DRGSVPAHVQSVLPRRHSALRRERRRSLERRTIYEFWPWSCERETAVRLKRFQYLDCVVRNYRYSVSSVGRFRLGQKDCDIGHPVSHRFYSSFTFASGLGCNDKRPRPLVIEWRGASVRCLSMLSVLRNGHYIKRVLLRFLRSFFSRFFSCYFFGYRCRSFGQFD